MSQPLYRLAVQQLAGSSLVRRTIGETQLARQLTNRFVAGETLEEAVAVARRLNEAGMLVSLDPLGESISSREEAIVAREGALEALRAIARLRLEANVSLKPTQLGLAIDREFCLQNIRTICSVARELGDGAGEYFVRLDMESSEFTEATIRLVEDLWAEGFRNVGTVLQSYLYRTVDDIRRLTSAGMRIRLVKGAYLEPPSVAYQSKQDVDRLYVRGMKMLLRSGTYPAIATHDEAMIQATRHFAFEAGIPQSSFEFQMLYGVRRDLQHRLVEEGHRVRVYVPYGEAWYPYLMRRLAERPGNLLFLARSIVKESPVGGAAVPVGLGLGILAGVKIGRSWRLRSPGRS